MLTGKQLRDQRTARQKKNSISVGQRIKAAREASDVKQGALAKKLGVSRSALSQWESGEPSSPISFEAIQDIASFTGANALYLMFGELADGKFGTPTPQQTVTIKVSGPVKIVQEREPA